MITEGKGRHAPAPHRKRLSRAEAILCLNAGTKIANYRNYRGSANRWKRGLVSDGFVDIPGLGTVRSDVAPYFLGFTGEIALVDLLNRRLGSRLTFDDTLRAAGDSGNDIDAYGVKVQVKSRQSDRAHARQKLNLIRHTDGGGRVCFPRAAVLVFCETSLSDLTVDILGWIHTSHARQLPVVAARKGTHRNIEVPDCELSPVAALVDWVSAKRGLTK